mmetsp:Transcript_16198/g.32298  ORF Transcript_16198/g.32298 Transcript_16198/m.32298 type:complete len:250 (-) Transcript_16198:353-1102(-)
MRGFGVCNRLCQRGRELGPHARSRELGTARRLQATAWVGRSGVPHLHEHWVRVGGRRQGERAPPPARQLLGWRPPQGLQPDWGLPTGPRASSLVCVPPGRQQRRQQRRRFPPTTGVLADRRGHLVRLCPRERRACWVQPGLQVARRVQRHQGAACHDEEGQRPRQPLFCTEQQPFYLTSVLHHHPGRALLVRWVLPGRPGHVAPQRRHPGLLPREPPEPAHPRRFRQTTAPPRRPRPTRARCRPRRIGN